MVAISIISKCNNNCKYCFQQDSYHKKSLIMSYNDFLDILEWSKGCGRISLFGGEPTLHPEVVKMADAVQKNDFFLVMLSNLVGPTKVYEKIIKIAPHAGWLINTTTRQELKPLFEENIKLFQKNKIQISAGITLMHDKEQDNSFIENLVRLGKEYQDVIRNYRVGIATPFHREKVDLLCYDEIALKLCELVKKETPNIPISFDCSTNMCQITPKALGILIDDYKVTGLKNELYCSPIIDISADKSVKYCASVPDDMLVTNTYKKFRNWQDCLNYFMKFRDNYMRKNGHICREKKKCINQMCTGTCLAITAYMNKQDMETNVPICVMK